MRFSAPAVFVILAASLGLSACVTSAPVYSKMDGTAPAVETAPTEKKPDAGSPIGGLFGGAPAPMMSHVDNELAVACQEAAGDKYFMDPNLVTAMSSSSDGGNTLVVLKVDSRDALCTLSGKGKVISIVDTSPKSAEQTAAEEQRAADIASGKVPAKPVAMSKKVKKKAKSAAIAPAAPKIAPVLGAR
jgi:hypothetical protein